MKKCLLFCVIVFAAFCGKTVAQNVTNLDFALREGKVVITYALDYPADIKAYYSLDDGNSYKEITKATGDLGALVTPSPMKRIDWDAFAEVENLEYLLFPDGWVDALRQKFLGLLALLASIL